MFAKQTLHVSGNALHFARASYRVAMLHETGELFFTFDLKSFSVFG